MTTPDPTAAVTRFLDSYRAAFERFDAPAIADHFAFPCHVVGAGEEVSLLAVSSREEWLPVLERLLGMYRAIGVGSARIAHLSVADLGPNLTQALVQWTLQDGAGHPLYAFDAAYTLAGVGGTLRVAALAHNEMPRSRELLVRLRAQSSR